MELLSGHEKIITKSRISLNAGTLKQGFTVYAYELMFYIPKISYSGTALVLCTIYESLSAPYWACSIPRTISAAPGPRYGNGAELQG
jgi:hypothetical protein